MLPASQSDNAPSQETRGDDRALLVLVVGLMIWTFMVGLLTLLGRIDPDGALLWMALTCLAPLAWNAYGFIKVQESEQDFGLLLSALGWALAAMALLFKYNAARLALQNNLGDERSTAATVCALLAFLCLAIGAALSLHAWNKDAANK